MSPRDRAIADATVLVCTRGRPGQAAEAVRSLLAGIVIPQEVIVIDQSELADPSLRTLDVPAACALRYVHRPGRGLSRARNLGFAMSSAEVVALLDDDMLVAPDWLSQLLAARGPDEITTGRVLAAPLRPGEQPVPLAALITLDHPEVHRGRQPRDVVPGASVALPRRLVLALGGYDERLGAGGRFPAGEDNDLGLRALDAGVVVRHVPGAISYHRGRPSRDQVLRQRWGYGLGKGAFYAKHHRRGDPYVRHRVTAELRRRVPRVVCAWRSPSTALADLIHLVGLAGGAIGWWIDGARHRLSRR